MTLLAVFCVQNADMLTRAVMRAQLTILQAGVMPEAQEQERFRSQVAGRLQRRIKSRFGVTLPVASIRTGMQERERISSGTHTVEFSSDDGHVFPSWDPDIAHHPLLIQTTVTPTAFSVTVNRDELSRQFRSFAQATIPSPSYSTIESLDDHATPTRVTSDQTAHFGYEFDADAAVSAIADAVQSGDSAALKVPLRAVKNLIINRTSRDLGSLTLLATGRSDFSGSGEGRKSNVRKGLGRLHNTLAPAGAVFSFTSVLGPVTTSNGWQMALEIFDGGRLRNVPGGGICQVATTFYRAILHGGFPITQRQSHSLFVHYYEKYGVGLDDTVFPGVLDLRFVNDTPNYLLIQTYTEGEEATVNIFGTPDGRKVTLSGPYFASAPPEHLPQASTIHSNQIGWIQTVEKDGVRTTHFFLSTYKTLSQSFAQKYPAGEEVVDD